MLYAKPLEIKLRRLALGFWVSSLLSCGQVEKSEEKVKTEQAGLELIEIPILLSSSQSLSLASSSFVVSLVGCQSGYTATHNTSTSGFSLNVYRADRDCSVKLEEFEWNASTWQPFSGEAFSGLGFSEFIDAGATHSVYVFNTTALSNPIDPSDSVSFVFAELESGDSLQLISIGGAQSWSEDPAYPAPSLSLNSLTKISLESIDSASGKAELSISLDCLSALELSECEAQELTNMDFLLIPLPVSYNFGSLLSEFSNSTPTAVEAGLIRSPSGLDPGGLELNLETPLALETCGNYIFALRHLDQAGDPQAFYTIEVSIASVESPCSG